MMGYKSDQKSSWTKDQISPRSTAIPSAPPPLPPRAEPALFDPESPPPPAYTENAETHHSQPLSQTWIEQDPRSSSTQSLVPEHDPEGSGKRTLLLIWVHGFMGNETSFQSFPAHVHNNVTARMEALEPQVTHQVHTKIYPKYKSKNKVEQARDGFSDWLAPHESSKTDIILLGHSMGGILSAEVALRPGTTKTFQHRIMGTINFDTPFLGMHPGVIASGLGSLFRPVPDTAEVAQEPTPLSTVENEPQKSTVLTHPDDAMTDSTRLMPIISSSSKISAPALTPLDSSIMDPNYNPPFPNDVRLPKRTGWSNAWHFINKHSDGLLSATKSYVTSHLEFGGCLADYNGLQTRYASLRALENVDPSQGSKVRFVNYYTASTGRPKKAKESSPQISRLSDTDMTVMNAGLGSIVPEAHQAQSLPLESESCDGKTKDTNAIGDDTQSAVIHLSNPGDDLDKTQRVFLDACQTMTHADPAPLTEEETADIDYATPHEPDLALASECSLRTESEAAQHLEELSDTTASLPPSLPPIPAAPEEPQSFDPANFPEKDTRRLAEKEHAGQVKTYQRMVKDRDRVIRDRRKYLEKREKNASREHEKQIQREEKERVKIRAREVEREAKKAKEKATPPEHESIKKEAAVSRPVNEKVAEDGKAKSEKSKRDKKFCLLPPTLNGQTDPCWIRVFMPGRDEVSAHCGLFIVDGERYEWLVADVAERIEAWVLATDKAKP